MFVKEGALLGQTFDLKTLKFTGDPFSIAPEIRYFFSTAWAPFGASKGTLIYQNHNDSFRMAWSDRTGRLLRNIGPAGGYLSLRFSPDGKKVVFDRTRSDLGTYDVWIYDLDRDAESRLTTASDTEFGGLEPGNDVTACAYHAGTGTRSSCEALHSCRGCSLE